MENSEFQMQEDDAGMVNEILNELNNSGSSNNAQPDVIPSAVPMPNLQPIVHPDASILNIPNIEEKVEAPQNNKNMFSDLFQKLKKPLILFVAVFIVFNPFTRKILNQHIPAIFQSTSSLRRQLAILILSLSVTLSYTGVLTIV